jgi:hypothetical protein
MPRPITNRDRMGYAPGRAVIAGLAASAGLVVDAERPAV